MPLERNSSHTCTRQNTPPYVTYSNFVPVALVPVALVPVALVPVALVPVALVPVALVPIALVPVLYSIVKHHYLKIATPI